MWITHDLPPGSLVDILDATGRELWNGRSSTTGSELLPVPVFGTGVYILRLSSGERVETTRFVE
ncbi:MAG: T9SS type A sorting domain-containing protein [Flavobacteriales bacterium]